MDHTYAGRVAMKKFGWIVVVILIMSANSFFADIAVNWNNTTTFLIDSGLSESPVDGSLVQLIWSPTLPVSGSNHWAKINGGVAVGQHVLASDTTESFLGHWSGNGMLVFNDDNVGGSDINNGYFFTRVFDSATPAAGSSYAEFATYDLPAGVLKDYDGTDASAYLTEMGPVAGDLSAAEFAGLAVVMDQTVVPEPSTVLFFGMGGLGAWLLRKNVKQLSTTELAQTE